jgi:phi LC3 family holin
MDLRRSKRVKTKIQIIKFIGVEKMKKINLKLRFQNKAFCVAFSSAVILLLQQIGLGKYLPENLMDIINSILLILSMCGIIVDPTTNGVGDSDTVLEKNNIKD